nr:MAG TPA: hypothetical protein [Caudoviricetes sp.]
MTVDYWFYKGSLSSKCIITIKARVILDEHSESIILIFFSYPYRVYYIEIKS